MVSIQHIFGVDVCLERQCMLRVIVAVYCCVREMSVIVRDTACMGRCPLYWSVDVTDSEEHGPPAWSVQFRAWSASFVSMLQTVFCMVRQLDMYMLLSVSYMVCQCWSVRDS